jgi:YfiH family protein
MDLDTSTSILRPEWPAPANVHALVTTRRFGDMSLAENKARLRQSLPAEPAWLKQVHGTAIVHAGEEGRDRPQADGAVAHRHGAVCAVMAADCMPVLLADERGAAVGAAHAGWRGLCAGVIEAALDAMEVPPQHVLAWLGPAIGPRAYEVGEEVRDAFLAKDGGAAAAFAPTRPGHWLLDLYLVARQRLERRGVPRIYGGGFCTYSDTASDTASGAARFYSFRRDRTAKRMAAVIWLGSP